MEYNESSQLLVLVSDSTTCFQISLSSTIIPWGKSRFLPDLTMPLILQHTRRFSVSFGYRYLQYSMSPGLDMILLVLQISGRQLRLQFEDFSPSEFFFFWRPQFLLFSIDQLNRHLFSLIRALNLLMSTIVISQNRQLFGNSRILIFRRKCPSLLILGFLQHLAQLDSFSRYS